jgi:hypothetical protein
MRTCTILLAWVMTAGVSVPVLAEETPAVTGKVDAVTVYRGQALVTRVVELAAGKGLREIVVTDLPAEVVPGSIYAESGDGVAVRSVRYRVSPVRQDVREEVRKLDEQIRQVQDGLTANERHRQVIAEQRAYLAKLEQFVAPTATLELTKGVLNAETLERLSGFLLASRQGLTDQELELGIKQRELTEQASVLQRERGELTESSARTEREAVVFLDIQQEAGARLRLRYLVGRATWSPSYNVRTGADRKEVVVEYNASIQQMSGEDWTDVVMTLSTATPSLVAKAPELTPLAVALAVPGPPVPQAPALKYEEAKAQLGQRLNQLVVARNAPAMAPPPQPAGQPGEAVPEGGVYLMQQLEQADKDLTHVADELQVFDLAAAGRIRREAKPAAARLEEGISVTYALEGRTTLPSRSDRQLIQVASLPMAGNFYKLATPVLTGYVYDEARVVNSSEMVLLAGPVSSFVGGQFMGHGSLPTVAKGQSFTVGLGIDSSVWASRELVEKTDVVQGGNKVVTFTYQLRLENFGEQPVQVRLIDRLPQAKGEALKVTLLSPEEELSKDGEYQRSERKKGILRWDEDVPAGASGGKAFTRDYKFQLEYDKNMTIGGLAGQ